jgi:hypothetical protein
VRAREERLKQQCEEEASLKASTGGLPLDLDLVT